MDHTSMLTHVLKLHFGWHLARIQCLSCLIIALFKVKTVNFVELATAFSGSAKVDSHYRRIQRFFKEVNIEPATVARLVASLLVHDHRVEFVGLQCERGNSHPYAFYNVTGS